jgi:hypothetical protein
METSKLPQSRGLNIDQFQLFWGGEKGIPAILILQGGFIMLVYNCHLHPFAIFLMYDKA